MDFAECYRSVIEPLFGPVAPEHGMSLAPLEDGERRLGKTLPAALREFYLVAGELAAVMSACDRFYSPANIRIEGGMLIFLEESQWGWMLAGENSPANIRVEIPHGLSWRGQRLDDPPFSQGRRQDGGRFDWVKEEDHCSDFLIGMVYWQALNGGLPHHTQWGPLPSSWTDPVRARLPLVWQDVSTQVFSQGGWVLGLTTYGAGDVNAELAYRTTQDRLNISELAGVDWLVPPSQEE